MENSTQNMLEVIVILYMIISVIIMLNILIAMLNTTYENIQGNSDLEWKFSRAVLLAVSELKFHRRINLCGKPTESGNTGP